VGEQSNAYRILLRYDRKSRHRRIKKQRRYERLAATSQFRTTYARRVSLHVLLRRGGSPFNRTLSPVGVARTLNPIGPTPYRALNRLAVANSAAGCLILQILTPRRALGVTQRVVL
jgi:hypothetical protein